MGGDDGPGTNPEQLFAVGYSACFLGAMHAAARRAKTPLTEEATVTADVSFADREDNVGFTIVAKLTANGAGAGQGSDIEARSDEATAHDICPYLQPHPERARGGAGSRGTRTSGPQTVLVSRRGVSPLQQRSRSAAQSGWMRSHSSCHSLASTERRLP